MSYDPRQNLHAPPVGQSAVGWAHVLHPAARPDAPGSGDDGLVHLAGIILAAVATLLLATTAAVVGLAAYGIITWRRTRWWPPAVAGGLLAVVAVGALGGPGPALHHHLLAARELAAPHPGGLADLVLRRWSPWAAAQVPLSVPLGLVAAGFARHHVTHTPAHELSGSAQARRTAEDRAHVRRARSRAGDAPPAVRGKPVLGAWVGGDLHEWRTGEWCTIPAGILGLGTVVVGLPGAGKTETILRLAQVALAGGHDVHIVDAKGDPDTQARFAAIASAAGHQTKLFPQEPYDGWRGDPTALRNRLGRVVDYTEPYYQDGARVAVDHATRRGAKSLEQLLVGLADTDLDIDNAVRKGTLSRYRSFAAAVGEQLSGRWAFEDCHASYILLDGVALGDDTPRLARYLLEDFLHYASTRKAEGRKALLIVDEFSALRVSNAAALLERLRSFGCGVVIAAQSVEGLHDDPSERARLLGAATTVIAHRLADPELVAARAGTTKRAERSHQLDPTGATGMGSLRIQETYRIDPNDLRNLPPGVAWITTAGRAAKTAIAQAGGAATTAAGPGPTTDRPVPTLQPEAPTPSAPRPPTAPPPVPSRSKATAPRPTANRAQQTLPLDPPDAEPPAPEAASAAAPSGDHAAVQPPALPRRVSPYAEGL
ncbi:MAG: hypothetical protein QOF96_2622 [Actinomycetota bacterium]|nr:hypothetical protein [Actinomycetota bacterium]